MPAIYAHYKMGTEVRSLLKMKNPNASKAVEAYPDLFMVGLHGPDILFFYKALKSNKISKLGHEIHKEPGSRFFEKAAAVTETHKDNLAYWSYLYGVICHFALDLSCHGYVAEKIKASGISHTEIESEFDGSLMRRDGLNPITYKPTSHLKVDADGSDVIKEFYPGTTANQVASSINSMRKISDFLVTSSSAKRNFLFTAMNLTGLKGAKGLIMNQVPNPTCKNSNAELTRRLELSIPLALDLINQVENYISKKTPLGTEFEYGFNSINKKEALTW